MDAYLDLIAYARDFLGKTLSFGWKLHILSAHLTDFLSNQEHGLGVYAEQTSESCHKAMKKTFSRFKVTSKGNGNLKKSAVVFSSMRI